MDARFLGPLSLVIFLGCSLEHPAISDRQAAPASPVAAVSVEAVLEADRALRVWRGDEASGVALARHRGELMRGLLLNEPQRALSLAWAPAERDALPAPVAAEVERWRDALGTLHVIGGDQVDGPDAEIERFVTFDDEPGVVLRAGVFGRRAHQMSREHVPLHGVVLGGLIALTESPLRRLGLDEASSARGKPSPTACAAGAPTPYHAGARVYDFCATEEARALEANLLADEEAPASSWTEGPKTILYIRVDFSDKAGDPVSQSSAESTMNATVRTFYEQASYGKTTTTTTVTPTLRLTKTRADYQASQDYMGLMTEARALAKAAGFDPAGYDFDIIAFTSTFSGGWAGRGYIGGKGTWLNGYFDLRVVGHELGHNLGAYHANYWVANGLTIFGPGTSQEYGNIFDMMGSSGGASSHFNAWVKRMFGWIAAEEVAVVATDGSGTYRLQSLESPISSGYHAVKIPRDAQKDYWLEFRTALNNVSLQNGVTVNFGYLSNTTSNLLDTTPGDNDKTNAAVVIGRTFSDPLAGIHVTPVAKGGAAPQWIDVVVNRGAFTGNRAPSVSLAASTTSPSTGQSVTLNATAADPDGDVLAYAWSFDDGSLGPNASTATKSYPTARPYTVIVTVSDMKGATASASVVLMVGTTTTFTLAGQVLSQGQPLGGVRISDGTRATFTTSDGRYTLSNVPAGTVTLSAAKLEYTFAPTFASPVTVTGSTSGLDFTATAAAGYQVTGRVSYGSGGVAGAVVTDGTRSATTNANGDYTLPNVPSGRYTLSASRAGWVFAPGFTNPVEVFGANSTGANFYASGHTLSGKLPPAAGNPDGGTTPTVSDGVRTVSAWWSPGIEGQGTAGWTYFLTGVPSGTWNLVATAPGVTLVPDNFTNPVTAGASTPDNGGGGGTGGSDERAGYDFKLAASAGVQVSGTVKTGGTPLPGVVVSDGTRSSTTDDLGRFVLVGVPPGSFTLTPTLAGYAFTPASRAVTVAGANLTGQDFSTTVVNLPPTVATAAKATPNPVTSGTSTLLAVLGADDGAEASLTYTWASTSGLPYPVLFSANGTNAAKSATATFTRAGTYTLECTITDAGGLSVRTSTTVEVRQLLTSLSVAPPTAAVLPLAKVSFTGKPVDQFGSAMSVAGATWTLSGGGAVTPTTGASTSFTAAATPGGPYTLTFSAGGKSATASITVLASGSPAIVSPASASPSPVTAQSTTLSVRASDDGGEPALSYHWQQTGGPEVATFSANDSNQAKDTVTTFAKAGEYTFLVTVTDAGGLSITSAVTVTVSATPTHLSLEPGVVSLEVGGVQLFTSTASDQFDEPLVPQPAITFAVSAGGTVDATGRFTAGNTEGGPFTLTATAGTLSATAQISVGPRPDTQPPTVALTAPSPGAELDGSAPLTATASDDVGVTRVEFWLDGTSKLGDLSAGPWTLEVDFSSVSPGAHQLTAKAFDAAGNSAVSDTVAVTVAHLTADTQPPSVSLSAPLAGTTTGLVVTVTAEATDDVGVTRVDLELDGAVVKSLTAAPWTASLEVSAGAHGLVAVAHDAAGHSTRSEAVSFTAQDASPGGPVQGGCASAGADGGLASTLGALLLGLALKRRRAPRAY